MFFAHGQSGQTRGARSGQRKNILLHDGPPLGDTKTVLMEDVKMRKIYLFSLSVLSIALKRLSPLRAVSEKPIISGGNRKKK